MPPSEMELEPSSIAYLPEQPRKDSTYFCLYEQFQEMSILFVLSGSLFSSRSTGSGKTRSWYNNYYGNSSPHAIGSASRAIHDPNWIYEMSTPAYSSPNLKHVNSTAIRGAIVWPDCH